MVYSNILKNLYKHIALTQHEEEHFLSLLKYQEVRKRDFVLQQGTVCKSIYFVNSGMLRAFFTDQETKESTIMFAMEDWWITDMHCFLQQSAAMLSIQALEASTVLKLNKQDLDALYNKVPTFERFFRILMQNAYVREQVRVLENLSLPAQVRYGNFIKKYPQIAQQVPQKQIASYLGITPEFLSSIRSIKRL